MNDRPGNQGNGGVGGPTGAGRMEPYRPGDEEEINRMYNEVFGFGRTLEEWHWKYRRNPVAELTMIRKLVHEGRIIGHFASLVGEYKVGGKRLLGGQVVDLLIRPPFQRKKFITFLNLEIGRAMKGVALRHGIGFRFGFPNELSYPILMRHVEGAADLMEVPIWRRRLTPTGLLGRLGGILRPALRSRARRRHGGDGAEPGAGRRFQVRILAEAEPCLDDLWETCSRGIEICLVRDRKFLAWRFFDKPGAPYTFRLLEEGGRPAGYVVTSTVEEEGRRVGRIVDLLARPGQEAVGALLEAALEAMEPEGVEVAECLAVAGSPLSRALVARGFRAEPRGVKMIAQLLDPDTDLEYFFEPTHWHVTFGDLDGP